MMIISLFTPQHITFYIQTDDFLLGVGTNGNGLAEVSREFTRTIVSNDNFTAFARLDGFLWVLRNGTSTRGDGLMDDQQIVAGIGKLERASDLRS